MAGMTLSCVCALTLLVSCPALLSAQDKPMDPDAHQRRPRYAFTPILIERGKTAIEVIPPSRSRRKLLIVQPA